MTARKTKTMSINSSFIIPDWPAPKNVKSLQTTRMGGVSQGVFTGFNLGDHVADDPSYVALNRKQLADQLPSRPKWLTQVHGVDVVNVATCEQGVSADASFCHEPNGVCVVMTADCLPLLFCDEQGRQVAAAHAGWRGLLDGVIEQTLQTFTSPMSQVLVWLGPAIGPEAFEVGAEVRAAFIEKDPAAEVCFKPSGQANKWLADIYALAKLRLQAKGVSKIYGGEFCTFSQADTFFSYRRDGQTGRMASCIWREK